MRHLLFFLSLCTLLNACQIPKIELSTRQTPIQEEDLPHKTYQATGNVCSAADGGLTTVLSRQATNYRSGSYTGPSASRTEVVVVKLDLQGKLHWTKLIWAGLSSNNSRPLIHALDDGGYLVFLYTLRYTAGPRDQFPMLIHLNSLGEVLTTQIFDNANLDNSFTALKIQALADKGFIISGRSYNGSGPTPVLIRFDGQGHLQWKQTYAPIPNANGYKLAATSDGGFMLFWVSNTNTQVGFETTLMKLDAKGQQVSLRKYGFFASSIALSQANDGGFVALGKFTGNSTNMVLYKLTKDGSIQWVQLYPLSGAATYATPLGVYSSASEYVLVYAAPSEVEFLTTSLAGIEQSRRSVSGTLSGDNDDILHLSDESFAYVNPNSYGKITLTKTKPDKSLDWSSVLASNN